MAPGLGRSLTGTLTKTGVVEVDEEALQCASELRKFFTDAHGSPLRAWLRSFDGGQDHKIGLPEFVRGMRRLEHPGDPTAIFNVLDPQHLGEISLEDVDRQAASLWNHFRAWCSALFEGTRAMVLTLSQDHQANAQKERVSKVSFCEMLPKLGWTMKQEEMLFLALDTSDHGYITASELQWLMVEKRQQRRKEQAKKKAMLDTRRRAQDRRAAESSLHEFKSFLRARYGNLVRAWRRALTTDDSMVLQRADFFKACTRMGWQGDVRLLWRGFDRDDSGYIAIEELDAAAALVIARFRAFVGARFGTMSAAFQALDRHRSGKIRQQDFIAALKVQGYTHATKSLFQALDVNGQKSVLEEDLLFLDRWKPPSYLLAEPNPQAAEDIKALLLQTYRNYLKAWRHCLDLDSSNRVNWEEFEAACKRLPPKGISYQGDVAGAWRHLDDDLSGYITLKEIDPAANQVLLDFKTWADDEFGGVRSAFGVFDCDASQEVNYREFRKGCRRYGYAGDTHSLFRALDVDRNGVLGLDQVSFLDNWDVPEPPVPMDPSWAAASGGDTLSGGNSIRSTEYGGSTTCADSQLLTIYHSVGPGPGTYAPPTTVGAGPLAPTVRFAGAYQFGRRYPLMLPGIGAPRDSSDFPSPGDYDDRQGIDALAPGKPSCIFGTERRRVVEVSEKLPVGHSPGPGSYACRSATAAPSYSCSPRRPLKIHPLFRQQDAPHSARR
mmetsp:Transcript_7709/g.16945  ORF Transcript_7709/g.16945 Transcript_7709/m.16945 type:complete len:721 (-) Transcript_7709:15-2177(-)